MSVEVRLCGEAATQAQHLVAELASQGITVEPLHESDTDRDVQQFLNDVAVGLAVEATYQFVREVVDAWISRSNLPQDDVEVVDPKEEDGDGACPPN